LYVQFLLSFKAHQSVNKQDVKFANEPMEKHACKMGGGNSTHYYLNLELACKNSTSKASHHYL